MKADLGHRALHCLACSKASSPNVGALEKEETPGMIVQMLGCWKWVIGVVALLVVSDSVVYLSSRTSPSRNRKSCLNLMDA